MIAIGEQFASAIDQTPPPPDPAVVAMASTYLRDALAARTEAIANCAAAEPTQTTQPGG